jgi:hypothetical protein
VSRALHGRHPCFLRVATQARDEEEEMKYLTPKVLARRRLLEADVAEAAAEKLEQASNAYRARIKAIRSRLPRDVRHLLSAVSLHDAKVLSVSFGKPKPVFILRVQLEGARNHPGEVLELIYQVVAGQKRGVAFRKHRPFEEAPDDSHWALNNEFDADEDRGFFTHSLLLTSGVEIEVRFRSLSVQSLEAVASPLPLGKEKRTWPLVEA